MTATRSRSGSGELKERGARVIGVNPIRTGYNAVADDWFGITPGTDGLLILSLIHCLLEAGKIDLDYLVALDERGLSGGRDGRARRRACSCAMPKASPS